MAADLAYMTPPRPPREVPMECPWAPSRVQRDLPRLRATWEFADPEAETDLESDMDGDGDGDGDGDADHSARDRLQHRYEREMGLFHAAEFYPRRPGHFGIAFDFRMFASTHYAVPPRPREVVVPGGSDEEESAHAPGTPRPLSPDILHPTPASSPVSLN
jgi:hypothetical protein